MKSDFDTLSGLLAPSDLGRTLGLRPITTMREQNIGLPIVEGGIVFLGKRPPAMRAFKMAGRHCVITRMHVPQAYTAYNVPDPNWITLHIPLTWSGDYVFDGYQVCEGDAFLADCLNGYSTAGENRDAITLGATREAIETAMRSMNGGCDSAFEFCASIIQPSPVLLQAVAGQIHAAIGVERSLGTRRELHFMPEVVERDFIDILAMEFRSAESTNAVTSGLSRRAVDVVAEARQLTLSHSSSVPSLSEICAITGVGQTRLFECFQEVHGLSPYKCLMAFRLSAAHERLTDKDNPPHSVKQVALDSGFVKPGRFAESFLRQFGELPSEILKQTQHEALMNK